LQSLNPTIDNRSLHDTFSQYGRILSCKVATDANGASRGYGFIHYESEESAKKAIDEVGGGGHAWGLACHCMLTSKHMHMCTHEL